MEAGHDGDRGLKLLNSINTRLKKEKKQGKGVVEHDRDRGNTKKKSLFPVNQVRPRKNIRAGENLFQNISFLG